MMHKINYLHKPPRLVEFSLEKKEEKMKRIFTFIIILMALTACAAPQTQAGLPNPASVYCEQNGNTLEIRTADDGSQNGICIFPDGSTCDEWAYYRGECGPTPAMTVEATTEEIADWRGVIKSTEPGAQYDDYFELWTNGQIIYFGIDSMDPVVQAQIEALRNSGKIVHLYGTLFSNVPDFNGSQILVDRIEVEEQAPGSYMPPGATEEIVDWWGVIKSTEPGAQYDDYFERQDFVQIIYFGIDSMDPVVKSQIEALRDSGKIVHLYGTLLSNVPDYNGSQIQVNRIEVEE
jgi:putative hemolysin